MSEEIKPNMRHGFVLGKILKLISQSGYGIKGASYVETPEKGTIEISMTDMNQTVADILEKLPSPQEVGIGGLLKKQDGIHDKDWIDGWNDILHHLAQTYPNGIVIKREK